MPGPSSSQLQSAKEPPPTPPGRSDGRAAMDGVAGPQHGSSTAAAGGPGASLDEQSLRRRVTEAFVNGIQAAQEASGRGGSSVAAPQPRPHQVRRRGQKAQKGRKGRKGWKVVTACSHRAVMLHLNGCVTAVAEAGPVGAAKMRP